MEKKENREKSSETIIVEREENMLSHIEDSPTLRIGRFLNPSVTSINEAATVPSVPLLSEAIAHDFTKWPSKILFKGWKHPQLKWEQWVDQLAPFHASIWNQSGICDSIIGSIYKFELDKNLLLGLVEFWCSETNTFVFPWGEATITLEDILILGGFSVIGSPVNSPLINGDLIEISDNLNEEYRACYKSKARKASDNEWMNRFMGSNSELELVAFLSLWLSRYVFPAHPGNVVRKQVFPVAILLAQGTHVALAPAILAGLYRELTLLKNQVSDNSRKNPGPINVWGLFHLVQIWVWEHFPPLRPSSINVLKPGEPRVARWQKLKSNSELSVVRSTLSSSENFQWRPYIVSVSNWRWPLFYREREELVDVQAENDELISFFCCLRACEIFGLDGSMERYHPHRVARQFCFDQDLPGKFSRANTSLDSAWKTYAKSTSNGKSFVRSRFLESSVTMRYIEWWKRLMSVREDKIKKILEQEAMWKNLKSSKCSLKNDLKFSHCSTTSAAKNPVSTHENSRAELENPVSTHEDSRARPEEDTSEDDDDLPLAFRFKLSHCSTTSAGENPVSSTLENSRAKPGNPVSTLEGSRVRQEEDTSEDDDDLPLAIRFKLEQKSSRHDKSSSSASFSAEPQTLMSSTVTKMGKKRKRGAQIDNEVDEKVVDKEGKLEGSVKDPLSVDDYEEGTAEKPVYIDYGGRSRVRSKWRGTAETVILD